MIELRHLTVGYGKQAVLSDINATLDTGKTVCLLGANGCGKSTLLRTLAGFQQPLCGHIMVEGESLMSMTPKQRSRLVSVVLTERTLVQNMKVRDLVALGRSPYTGFFGRLSEEDECAISDAIRMVGIADLAGRAIDTLSDGERQKVMMAKSFAQQTPVILLDEPTAFLDFHAKLDTFRLMLQLAHRMNKIIIMSTHDVEMAIQLCDTLWIVQDGAIKAGRAEELTKDGTLQHFLQSDGIRFDAQSRSIIITA